MQITTDRGKSWRAVWAEAPTPLLGRLIAEIIDNRTVSEIAKDLEGVSVITITDDYGKARPYAGYTELVKVSRNLQAGTAQIHYEKTEEGNA